MTVEKENALLAKVGEILQREDTVLFIGAGLSRWSGLPSWKGLIEELADFIESQGLSADLVRKEAKANDLLQAASYGVDLLTKPQFAEFMRKACRFGTASPHEIHSKVVRLGPTCFITTNYDHLIEESLNKWRPDQYSRIVSNKQLTETADIIQARATNFVFKPHGDVCDIDSVILTREQYRVLYGDKAHILKATETLLVSRPVVFIGFGLRDLDFMYVKDLLANTYKGGAVDHYAIMADVSNQEKTYWRKNYGIHILSYSTVKQAESGITDHSPLLDLIDDLLKVLTEKIEPAPRDEVAPDTLELTPSRILAIARYAAHLTSTQAVESEVHLPLQVIPFEEKHRPLRLWQSTLRFAGSPVERFLEQFPSNSLLIGNPGAGKTYAFRRACTRLAQQLQDACLCDSDRLPTLVIPIYLDLKLYTGDLWRMAEQTLPPELSLESLITGGNVRFFLDSFNEMPREHLDGEAYERDFSSFMGKVGNCTVTIASRTDDGLQRLGLAIFRLDEISRDFVAEYLEERGVIIDGVFRREVLALLQKPLFFRLYLEGKVDLSADIHPRQVFRSLFHKLAEDFEEKFDVSISVEEILASIAYTAIDEGQEALLLSQLQTQLRQVLSRVGISVVDAMHLINWLIARDILVPASGSRLTFFHQSVTEYLAAQELARLYSAVPDVLDKHLRHTRWDQTLFLALGFLQDKESESFIQQVLETDILSAVRAAKYVEIGQEQVVSKILQLLINDSISYEQGFGLDDISTVSHNLTELPVSAVHDHSLKQLLKKRNVLGGAAANLLVQIYREAIKDELIDEIFSNPDDYNYCTDIGRCIQPIISSSDLASILTQLGSMECKGEGKLQGLISGLGFTFGKLDIAEVRAMFSPWQHLNDLQMEVLCEILEDKKTNQALAMAIELVGGGVEKAIFPLHLLIDFHDEKEAIDWTLFNENVLAALIEALSHGEPGQWALEVIKQICISRPDLSYVIKNAASQATGITRLSLLFCLDDSAHFWEEMSRLSQEPLPNLDDEPLFLLRVMEDLEWKGKESTLIGILRQRNVELAQHLLETFVFPMKELSFRVAIDSVNWWLEWMNEVATSGSGFSYWFCDRLGHFLTNYTTPETQLLFVEEFNKKDCPYREVLVRHVLSKMQDLTTESLNEDAISFLIADLSQRPRWTFEETLLGNIASESFVEQRLLPLLSLDEEPLKSNLRATVRQAGRRHRRRYITDIS